MDLNRCLMDFEKKIINEKSIAIKKISDSSKPLILIKLLQSNVMAMKEMDDIKKGKI